MFQQRKDNRSELFSRRQCFIKEIQNSSRQSIKKRARSQMIRLHSQQQLNQILSKPQQEFSQQDLAQLVHYANSQFIHAVGHLGNLLLDGVVKISQLQRFELKPGFHPYWLWLIEVLVEKQYCTLPLLQHCIKSISPKRSPATVNKALTIIYKLVFTNLCSLQLLKNEKFLLSVLNSYFLNNSANEIALGLIYELFVRANQQELQKFMISIAVSKLISILSQGSLCNNRKIKLLSCRIMIQMCKKSIFYPQLCAVILRMLIQAKKYSFVQTMLELLMQLVQFGSKQYLLALIEGGMIVELGTLKQQLLNDDQDQYIVSKVVDLGREVNEKMKDMGYLTKGIHRQLQRFQLLKVCHKMDIC